MRIGPVLALTVAAALTGCSVNYTTGIPSATPVVVASTAGNPSGTCANPTQTLNPLSPLPQPGAMPKGWLDAIAGRGRLIVGVVNDQQPLAWRDPVSGEFRGMEVDLYRAVAKALLGDASKVEVRSLTPEAATTQLADGSVDLAIGALAMTCGRWTRISMSAPYLHTQVRLLTRRGSTLTSPAALKGRGVCVVGGTPYASAVPGATIVAAPTATGCLVKLQAGEVEAVADGLPVLAGLAAQDPFSQLTEGGLGELDYAVGVAKNRPELVQFVNAVLARWVADGGWQASYATWLKPSLGEATAPVPVYGRQP